MRAIVIRAFGGPEVMRVEQVPDPVAGAGQVVVRLHAAGVNPADTYMRSGSYARKPDLPYIPGTDGAGLVEAVGAGVEGLRPGDRVYTAGVEPLPMNGSYAERVVCRPGHLHRLPDGVSFEQGAGIHVPYATAYRALFNLARAEAGETVLVHGASGGVGTAAVQLARARGVRVIGTAGTEEGLALVRAQGADHAFNHRAEGYLQEIVACCGGRGPDVIVEMLANVNLDRDLGIVAPGGRIVVVGNRGRVEIDARQIMQKGSTVTGMILWNSSPAELAGIHLAIVAGLDNGSLRPVVGTALPLDEAPAAHVKVMEPGAHGKIVLTM